MELPLIVAKGALSTRIPIAVPPAPPLAPAPKPLRPRVPRMPLIWLNRREALADFWTQIPTVKSPDPFRIVFASRFGDPNHSAKMPANELLIVLWETHASD